jgi:DNA-binding response OmpR family regulator
MPLRGTVLLVNSFDDGRVYAEYLRAHDLDVHAVHRPEEALRDLDTIDPDVVITDLVFSDRTTSSGMRLIESLRARLGSSVSIMVVSGYVRDVDRAAARQAGADCFVPKPAAPEAVLEDVRRALILRRSGRRLPWSRAPKRSDAVVPIRDRRRAS